MDDFVATHTIVTTERRIPVRADLDSNGNGPLYTQAEWDSETSADWELVDGLVLFQGNQGLGALETPSIGTKQYVVIAGESYPVDTEHQISMAIAAMIEAGLSETPIWHGDTDDPDSYESSTLKLFAHPAAS